MDDEAVLVSACLLGMDCTYRGGNERREALLAALAGFAVVPVCPEAAGGLGIPRPRCEVDGGDGGAVLDGRGRVRTAGGEDHTDAYVAGAGVAVDAARRNGIRLAVLKDRSPSCGCAGAYDGTHTRTFNQAGEGVAAAALRRAGVEVATESTAPEALRARRRGAGS